MAALPRQERKKLQSANALKTALTQLILDGNDTEAITVSEITELADYNRSTFYFHYKDKNEIMEELFTDAVEGLRSAIISPYRDCRIVDLNAFPPSPPSTRLSFEHIEKNKSLFKALHAIRTIDSLYDRMEQMYWELFSKKVHFHWNNDVKVDYELTASYHIHAMIGAIKYWIRSNFKYSTDYMCEQFTIVNGNPPTGLVILDGSSQ